MEFIPKYQTFSKNLRDSGRSKEVDTHLMQASINNVLSRYSSLEADSEIWIYHLSKHEVFYMYIFPPPAHTQIIEKKVCYI